MSPKLCVVCSFTKRKGYRTQSAHTYCWCWKNILKKHSSGWFISYFIHNGLLIKLDSALWTIWHGLKNGKDNMRWDESNRSVLVCPAKCECVDKTSHLLPQPQCWREESINLVRQSSPLLVVCLCHTRCSFSTCLTCRPNFSSCHWCVCRPKIHLLSMWMRARLQTSCQHQHAKCHSSWQSQPGSEGKGGGAVLCLTWSKAINLWIKL